MNRELLKLAIPNILSNLTVPLVSLVDVGLMGHMPGPNYIIAIGFGVMIFNFMYWSFGFLRMGTTGITAQAFGAEKKTLLVETFYRALLIGLSAGVLLILFQAYIFDLAMLLIKPESLVQELIRSYFKIRIFAAPAAIGIFALTGWFFGVQNSKAALILAIAVNGANALLSYLFVVHYNMGMDGVAWGTLLGQYIGLLVGLLLIIIQYASLFKSVSLKFKALKTGWRKFISVNTDIFIRTLCLIFALSFFKTQAGNAGLLLGAANILLLEFITISAYGIDGFAFASEALCGKYFGKQMKVQFSKAVSLSFYWGLASALVFSLLFAIFGKAILNLLTNKAQVVEVAMEFIPWLILAPLINAFAFIWDGIFIATTASKAMRNSMLISVFVVFLPAYYLLEPQFKNHGLWLSLCLFMLARGIIQTYYYRGIILPRLNQTA